MKFSGILDNGIRNRSLNFVGNSNHLKIQKYFEGSIIFEEG